MGTCVGLSMGRWIARPAELQTAADAANAAEAAAQAIASVPQFQTASVATALHAANPKISQKSGNIGAYFTAAYNQVFAEYNLDHDFISSGKPAKDLAKIALWGNQTTIYDNLTQNWTDLKSYLLAQDENWWVWTQWYEDRLRGNTQQPFTLPFVKDVEIGVDFEKGQYGRCTLPEKIYEDPSKANAAIAGIIEDYWERQKSVQDNDVSDNIEDIIDATPLAENITLGSDGKFDVEFLPVRDLFSKNLTRIEDALRQALKANAFNEDSQEIKFLREILHSHSDDPQRIHDDCGFVASAISELIEKDIIPNDFAVKRLLDAVNQTQLDIRAYEPDVKNAFETRLKLRPDDTVEIDNEDIKSSAELIEHTQSEKLQSEIGTDISIIVGGERGAAAYRLLSRFSRMYQLIDNPAKNHVLTDAASLSLMQAMPHIGNIIQYLRHVFGL